MERIRVIHDIVGGTLTVWFGNPADEFVCEETNEEVVLMKDRGGRTIGLEILHYKPVNPEGELAVEAVVRVGP